MTAITTVRTKAMKRIVQQSLVPIINFCVPEEDRTVHRNVLRNHNCAMVNVIVKMAPMRRRLAVSIVHCNGILLLLCNLA